MPNRLIITNYIEVLLVCITILTKTVLPYVRPTYYYVLVLVLRGIYLAAIHSYAFCMYYMFLCI